MLGGVQHKEWHTQSPSLDQQPVHMPLQIGSQHTDCRKTSIVWHHMTHPWHPVTSHDPSMTSCDITWPLHDIMWHHTTHPWHPVTSHDPSMTSCDITWPIHDIMWHPWPIHDILWHHMTHPWHLWHHMTHPWHHVTSHEQMPMRWDYIEYSRRWPLAWIPGFSPAFESLGVRQKSASLEQYLHSITAKALQDI